MNLEEIIKNLESQAKDREYSADGDKESQLMKDAEVLRATIGILKHSFKDEHSDGNKIDNFPLDYKTREWAKKHPIAVTTMVKCEKCGLFYKPFLGHECEYKFNGMK